ncbi:hypothetical protein D9758_014748 [Tetrapyrgos nigripes]|uniref:Cobalamin-independent methionine synthase MetE C-terminal/archaeal domain-containing protein n=1 Tax=Tetrapyrgos nigripes TaxID=182062 RepID=A0A8H5CH94_9AGAR|nr:hypothetical protein D9758_014748 [Tetrapyrgos nigripes]
MINFLMILSCMKMIFDPTSSVLLVVAYITDLATAYREEIKELYDLGCRNIEIDDPQIAFFSYEPMIEQMRSQGKDPEYLLDTAIKAINLCTQGRPEDLCIGIHFCRGNHKGRSLFNSSYERIAKERVFERLDVDVFYLEFDNSNNSGDFSPLRNFPTDKAIVLGLVTSKNGQLESPEEIKSRVFEAATVMSEGHPTRSKEEALNQLCISPQCGFASTWEGNPVTEEDERKKLSLLIQTAKEIWETS